MSFSICPSTLPGLSGQLANRAIGPASQSLGPWVPGPQVPGLANVPWQIQRPGGVWAAPRRLRGAFVATGERRDWPAVEIAALPSPTLSPISVATASFEVPNASQTPRGIFPTVRDTGGGRRSVQEVTWQPARSETGEGVPPKTNKKIKKVSGVSGLRSRCLSQARWLNCGASDLPIDLIPR